MKTKLQVIIMFIFCALQINMSAQNNLKSIEGTDVPIDTVGEDVLSPVIISDGGDNVYGRWFMEDTDPSGWQIHNDIYDSDLDSYADELIGHRNDDDDNNTNSFRLWNPQDSGVVWNVTSPIVKFKIKITDEQDWTFGNVGNLGLYFWITIWDDYKMAYRTRKVRYNKGSIGVLDNGVNWSDYTPHGLGEDVDDGNWHEITVNLVEDIQESRDLACSNGDTEACKDWRFYTITALEVRALHIFLDDITVLPETSTDIEDNNFRNGIRLYPNPTNGIVSIVSEEYDEAFDVNVYNLVGNLLASYNQVFSGKKLDLSFLHKGTYIIKLNNTKTNLVKKLVIR